MFEISKLLPPPIRKNEEYHESSWDTMDMSYKEYIIRKKIKDVPPSEMQEEVKYYHIIPPKWCIDFIGTSEARDGRRCAVSEYQKPASKKNNTEQPDGDDSNSES